MIVTQLFKKYPTFLRNPKGNYSIHKIPPLDPILSQPNPVRHIHPCFSEVYPNIILQPTPTPS